MKYVLAIDRFLSGWGLSKNRKNLLVFEVADSDEADVVVGNIEARSEFDLIGVFGGFPDGYSRNEYFIQVKTKEVYPNFYKEGYFANQKEAA